MKRRKGTGSTSSSKRTLVSSAMKATSHPTRELILRELKEGPRSTLELEDVTRENRYNLYHHLGVLEEAHLVTSSVGTGRRKVFELLSPKRPGVAFLVLDGKDTEEARALGKVLEVLQAEMEEAIPHAAQIRRAKMIFYYPWSNED